jgi:glycine hydroxymethyltransferase
MGNIMNIIKNDDFLNKNLSDSDPELFKAIMDEHNRQEEEIELIASENIASSAVIQAQGSVLTNKYAEGYSGRRYYGGCKFVDVAENLAIERACKLFDCNYANVQPHSGSQANQAVFLSLLKPHETYLSMDLNAGGHLTHGAKPNQSGKWFNPIHYGVLKDTNLIDYDEVARLADEHKPKLIIAGGSAMPRKINFSLFKEIADSIDAKFLVDMAHISGLVAAGLHENPTKYADVVTSTTHKTLRGPRGGIILSNNEEIAKKINSAVFPGTQGGPLMHVIAAKAVAFGEALSKDFKVYQKNVLSNAKCLAESIMTGGLDLVTNGTDTHLLVVDLQSKNVTGNQIETALSSANITCNKNSIPFDKEKPTITSGIRLGTPACTTRGFNNEDFKLIGDWIVKIINNVSENNGVLQEDLKVNIKTNVKELCKKFPIYPLLR